MGRSSAPLEGEGKLVATSDPSAAGASAYKRGDRVFHQKFGYGRITGAEGDKLDIDFEKAGEKKVVAKFVVHAGSDGDLPF